MRFVHANVDELASVGITGLYDGILAAYLVRNLAEPNAALRTFHALLKPGAPLARARVLGGRLRAQQG